MLSVSDIAVLAGAVAAIGAVNWYFLLGDRGSVTAAITGGGLQQVPINVLGGYEPATIRVKRGSPVRLVFDRQETSSCSEEVVFPDFGIRKFLPPYQKTTVEFTPKDSGEFEFTCGMGMLRGRLIVEDGET
jgi:plastocyanin domain-containing protein